MTYGQTYERLKEALEMDELNYSATEREQFIHRIVDYGFFHRKSKPNLQEMKEDMATFLTNNADVIEGKKGFFNVCHSYEEQSLLHYLDDDKSKLLLSNPSDDKESTN